MQDLLLCVHAVVKNFNLEISRRHLADYVKNCTKLRAARAARLFSYSTNQIVVFCHRRCCYRRPCFSSLEPEVHGFQGCKATSRSTSDMVFSVSRKQALPVCRKCNRILLTNHITNTLLPVLSEGKGFPVPVECFNLVS